MKNENIIGKRITLIQMINEPYPVPSGTMGIVTHQGGGVINVDWDNGRRLGVIEDKDEYIIHE